MMDVPPPVQEFAPVVRHHAMLPIVITLVTMVVTRHAKETAIELAPEVATRAAADIKSFDTPKT
jgi:hypothetical protein